VKITEGSENKKAYSSIANMEPSVWNGIHDAKIKIGESLVKKSIELMKLPKSGRYYSVWVGKSGVKIYYRASAAGEAPAILSGNLRKSISYTIKGRDSMEFGSDASKARVTLSGTKDPVGTLKKYSRKLELGTSIAARPYLKPALGAEVKDAIVELATSIDKKI
jgi:hypothetical protein